MSTLSKSFTDNNEGMLERCSNLKRLTIGCFLLFLFFLPLYEAPKNIFSVLFVCFGLWVSFSQENAADRFKSGDMVVLTFCCLVITPFFAGLSSPYMDWPSRLSSALNWALMPLVALIMLLLNFSKTQLIWALRLICLGSVVAVIEAFYSWSGRYPELNSVGHVNQSALYLAFSLIPAILLAIRYSHISDIILAIAVFGAVFYYQGPAHSIIGLSASLSIVAGVWIMFCLNRNHKNILVGSISLGILIIWFAVQQPPEFFGHFKGFKHELDIRLGSKNDPYSQRDRLVNAAIEVSGDSLTGFGLGSFGAATHLSKIRTKLEARGGDWEVEKGNYYSSSHGHNIFANVLTERGWIGVSSIAFVLTYWLFYFGRGWRTVDSQIGILVIVMICLAGLGQSTLHVEHGQLTFICVVLCMISPQNLSTRKRNADIP